MTLKTRKPTGRTGWPRILVEGTDKAGKSWQLALLSRSPKVGRTVVLPLGEDISRWDEYGRIPGVRFELVEFDGTWRSIMEAVEDAKIEARAALDRGEPPMVFGIDSATAEWEGLKDWASFRARNSKDNRKLLASDPDAEIVVSGNYWNDARARHRALMRVLLTFPGIVIIIARGGEVTLYKDNKPVAGQKTWSVQGEGNLPFDVSAHVRLSREARPLLISASGVLDDAIRPGIDPPRKLPDDWSLESVIFGTLNLDSATAGVGGFTDMAADTLTPEMIRDEAILKATTFKRIQFLYAEAGRLRYDAVVLDNERGAEETLDRMLIRIGKDKQKAEMAAGAETPAAQAPAAAAGTDAEVAPPEDEFILGFTARLGNTPDDRLGEMEAEASRALTADVIGAGAYSELLAEIKRRKTAARQAVAA